jgi:hypothetical protein
MISVYAEGGAASPRASRASEIMGGPDKPGHDDQKRGG